VVCDQLAILGNSVVTMDEAGLLLTAEEHYPYGMLTMIVSLEAIGDPARERRGKGDLARREGRPLPIVPPPARCG